MKVESRSRNRSVGNLFSILTVAFAVSFLLSASSMAQNVSSIDIAFGVTFDSEMPLVERASGEIQVNTQNVFARPNGSPFTVSLVFADLGDYYAAASLGVTQIDLARLDSLMVRGESSEIEQLPLKGGLSLWNVMDEANGNVCGDVFARAIVELADGLHVGINLHAGSLRSGWVAFGSKAAEAEPLPDAGDCSNDTFGDCDFFAIGGCGGPTCHNVYDFGGDLGVNTYKGTCTVVVVPWAPDTCYCKSGARVVGAVGKN